MPEPAPIANDQPHIRPGGRRERSRATTNIMPDLQHAQDRIEELRKEVVKLHIGGDMFISDTDMFCLINIAGRAAELLRLCESGGEISGAREELATALRRLGNGKLT